MYIITEKRTVIDGRQYTVYGVKYDNEFYAEDVSADRQAVEKLTEDCNRYGLHPVHLSDVIEDFLAQI